MTTFLHRIINAEAAAWCKLVWGAAAGAMLVPLALELTVAEMAWDGFDFAVFGTMLLIGGLAFEAVVRFAGTSIWSLLATCLAIGGAFLMVMANLAVGIIGSENNPVNLLFPALLAAGGLGALAVRFRPGEMARIMALLAAGQTLLGLGLALTGLGLVPVFTAVYVALWLGCGALFRKAARLERQRTA